MLIVLKFRGHNHKVTVDHIVSIESAPLTEMFIESIIIYNGVTLIFSLYEVQGRAGLGHIYRLVHLVKHIFQAAAL
jgi:hypothetical protein